MVYGCRLSVESRTKSVISVTPSSYGSFGTINLRNWNNQKPIWQVPNLEVVVIFDGTTGGLNLNRGPRLENRATRSAGGGHTSRTAGLSHRRKRAYALKV